MEGGKSVDSFNAYSQNHPVDYMKIAAAISYYKEKGFSYIEVPWDTPKKYREITFSGIDFDPIGEDRYLVGSAEQSFIYLFDQDKIKRGSYVTCTPCYRGDIVDETHQQYFLKVELFDSNDTSEKRLNHIINLADLFFSKYVPTNIIQTDTLVYDIETVTGIELGSYGIRKWKDKTWIFATGLAEPRLSKSMLNIN
jgi:hypothetical protein